MKNGHPHETASTSSLSPGFRPAIKTVFANCLFPLEFPAGEKEPIN
jgi:hypothetical protein